MSDHAFFFAESVRMVLESKSRWSSADFENVLLKSRAVRDIVPSPGTNLDDTLAMLQLNVAALQEGRSHAGILRSSPHIATGAIFLAGGTNALLCPAETVEAETLREADDQWPDLLLLLEPGRVVFKDYSEEYGGRLFFYEYGADALLAFTNSLLQTIADRAVLTEGVFYLTRYAIQVLDIEPYAVLEFPLTRFVPGRTPLWE